MADAVVVWSGGLDSTVLLWHLLATAQPGETVHAVSVEYGQRHSRELKAARDIASDHGIAHTLVSLPGLRAVMKGSCLTDNVSVPHGHYEDETMRTTVVPNRNMLLLSVGIAQAISVGADTVAYAAHSGDHAVYPDCREEFADAMAYVARVCHYSAINLQRPFIGITKADIVRRGHDVGAPMARTWSCYEGGERHCGKCGTCVERREAFNLANVDDLTDYQTEDVK